MATQITDSDVSRRAVLRGAAGAATGGLAANAVAPVTAQAADEPDYGGWFDGTSNYDGTVDETGQETVTIAVGSQGNGGNFGFDPAAVRVDPGTKVVWEWSGKGGAHNVVAEDGRFESEMTDAAGHTFEQTVEESGVVRYACVPHESVGMKGALVVDGTQESGGTDISREDVLTLGGGFGLVGTLVAMFALGTRSGPRE